ncbi:hypothetical protein N7481_006147 [Penicillium waksmanii]|uniref:uncharacterized protein n=1 Tax=Penicillium waksmanii TaxID=69791 RepID=UPI0025486F22|nr:uncharacterized protein N7481_006147 [Penicillium waksmanii]KAJ5984048.1 hypothetical protein N7481_006147 [Penicillium waksmanii]
MGVGEHHSISHAVKLENEEKNEKNNPGTKRPLSKQAMRAKAYRAKKKPQRVAAQAAAQAKKAEKKKEDNEEASKTAKWDGKESNVGEKPEVEDVEKDETTEVAFDTEVGMLGEADIFEQQG